MDVRNGARLSPVGMVDQIFRIHAEFTVKLGFFAFRNAETGDMEEKMQVITEGKDLTIAFNVRYITDVLKALSDDQIVMRFNSNVSPCVVCPVEGDSYLYLVLPVRVFNA